MNLTDLQHAIRDVPAASLTEQDLVFLSASVALSPETVWERLETERLAHVMAGNQGRANRIDALQSRIEDYAAHKEDQ